MTGERIRRFIDLRAIPLAVVVGIIQIVGTTFAAACGTAGPDGFGPDPGFGSDPGFGDPDRRWGPPTGGPCTDDFNAGRLTLDWLGYALLTAGPLALAFRRRFPAAVVATMAAVDTAYLAIGYPYGPVFLSIVVALIGAVLHGARVAAWIAGWAMLVVYLAAQVLVPRGPGPDWGGLVGSVAWLLVILLVAEALRFRRERAAAAERARQQQARALADEERLRIARELHDVLAHNISMINIQAGVALHLGGELPEQARGALQAIKEASRDTLRELRATLGVLRQVDEDAPRAPTPSLSRLDDLVARTSASGLAVHKEVTGTVRTIPTGTDLAAYRIIQEALTNVHRHANADNAWVRVAHTDDALTVTVEDDGRGAADFDDGSGAGIAGMRERATALGGTLETGHRLAGGFRVRATLPLPPAESPSTGQQHPAPGDRALDPATDQPSDAATPRHDAPTDVPRDTTTDAGP